MDMLEIYSQQAKQFALALAKAGRPVPPPVQLDLPQPGDVVTDEHVVTIARQDPHGVSYLSEGQRKGLFARIMSSGIPGPKQKMKLDSYDDVWLCRMLANAWSMLFVKKAMNGFPFEGQPV